jgi:hypothetical protein
MDEVPWDDAELERLGFTKDATQSYALRAIQQTPLIWNEHQPLLKNLSNHLQSVWQQGKRNVQLAYADEATRMAYLPDSQKWDRFREYLRGENPVISHPVDKVVEQF